MERAYIGLGSNEGERELMISRAVQALKAHPRIRVLQLSFLKEYEPVGGPPQESYVNAVVEIETDLPPHELLAVLQVTERVLGRRPSAIRWGPRTIDLDLLLYGALVLNESGLTIPHPRLHERCFVLEPLAQVAPQLEHPMLHRSMQDLHDALCASSDRPANSARS